MKVYQFDFSIAIEADSVAQAEDGLARALRKGMIVRRAVRSIKRGGWVRSATVYKVVVVRPDGAIDFCRLKVAPGPGGGR